MSDRACLCVVPPPWLGESADAARANRPGMGLPYVVLLALFVPGECGLAQTRCSCDWFSELVRCGRTVEVCCADACNPVCRLTPHEVRLLKLLVQGHRYKTAAAELGVSPHTISFHLRRVYQKLDVHSKAEAVSKALRHGLV